MTRKKLSENEDDFIKGAGKPASKPATKPATQKDALSKLFEPSMPAPKDPTVRFTADLPYDLHRRLHLAAARAGKTKVELLREILAQVLPPIE